jgi:hypothetical protein
MFFHPLVVAQSPPLYGIHRSPDELAKLSKVKANLEIVGVYADMEKVRDFVKQLAP